MSTMMRNAGCHRKLGKILSNHVKVDVAYYNVAYISQTNVEQNALKQIVRLH